MNVISRIETAPVDLFRDTVGR